MGSGPDKNKRAMGIGAAVLSYFDKHPDITVYLKDIAQETGYPEDKVQASINGMRNRNVGDLATRCTIVMAGQAWRVSSKPVSLLKSTKRLFEERFTTDRGTIIVEEVDSGKLYSLKELDI